MNTSRTGRVWSPEVIRDAPGESILVVDFARLSGQRDAIDVVAEAFADQALLRLDPVVALSGEIGAAVSLDELADWAVAGLVADGRTPGLVIGYCSGAPLAMRITALLAADTDVGLALLAPGFPHWGHVAADLTEILQTLGGVREEPVLVPSDGLRARAYVNDVIDEALRRAAVDLGLGEESVETLTGELGSRYKAWLHYLVCTVEAETLTMDADLAVLEMPEPWAAPRAGWPAHAELVRSSVPRDLVLDSEDAATLVRRVVGALR